MKHSPAYRLWRGLKLFLSLVWRPIIAPVGKDDPSPVVYCSPQLAFEIAKIIWS